jgi:hypothetical protein
MPVGSPCAHARRADREPKGDALTGVVFTVDDGMLVLEQYNSSAVDAKAAYHVVNLTAARSIDVTAPPPTALADAELTPLPPINEKAVETRLERSVARAEADSSKLNGEVTERDQAIFFALSKTMPCKWAQNNGPWVIIVMEQVRLRPCAARGAARGRRTDAARPRDQALPCRVLHRRRASHALADHRPAAVRPGPGHGSRRGIARSRQVCPAGHLAEEAAGPVRGRAVFVSSARGVIVRPKRFTRSQRRDALASEHSAGLRGLALVRGGTRQREAELLFFSGEAFFSGHHTPTHSTPFPWALIV